MSTYQDELKPHIYRSQDNHWHLLSVYKPPMHTRILVINKDGLICIADYSVIDGRMFWEFESETPNWKYTPVAWQFLPEFNARMFNHFMGDDDDSNAHSQQDYAIEGLLPDFVIRALCAAELPMITPFIDYQVRADDNNNPAISYGLSSAGYDIRLGPHAYIVKYPIGNYISPKYPVHSETPARHADGGFIIPPNCTFIGASIERFHLPPDVMCIIVGKSTYARCGIHLLTTPAEPEWEGHLTLEISNLNPEPAVVYPNEGIAQCLFFRIGTRPSVTYADREGKYQGQPAHPIASRV